MRLSFLGIEKLSEAQTAEAVGATELHAAGNRFFTLEWITPFTALQILDLRHNFLRAVCGIEACSALRECELRDNRLGDLEDAVGRLVQCRALRSLDARHNPFGRGFYDDSLLALSPARGTAAQHAAQATQEARLRWRSQLIGALLDLESLDGLKARLVLDPVPCISFQSSHTHPIFIAHPSHSHLTPIPFPSHSHPIPISLPSHSHLTPIPFPSHSHPIPVSSHPIPISSHPIPISSHPIPIALSSPLASLASLVSHSSQPSRSIQRSAYSAQGPPPLVARLSSVSRLRSPIPLASPPHRLHASPPSRPPWWMVPTWMALRRLPYIEALPLCRLPVLPSPCHHLARRPARAPPREASTHPKEMAPAALSLVGPPREAASRVARLSGRGDAGAHAGVRW